MQRRLLLSIYSPGNITVEEKLLTKMYFEESIKRFFCCSGHQRFAPPLCSPAQTLTVREITEQLMFTLKNHKIHQIECLIHSKVCFFIFSWSPFMKSWRTKRDDARESTYSNPHPIRGQLVPAHLHLVYTPLHNTQTTVTSLQSRVTSPQTPVTSPHL